MSVTVDHQPLPVEQLGLKTIGQVLAHIQKEKKLVVQVLVDGQEPDLSRLDELKAAPLLGHTIFIETSQPQQIALEALDAIESQLAQADHLTSLAIELLRENQNAKAIEKLRGCFSSWQHAQESILKVAQLLRVDLSRVLVDGRPFTQVIGEFAEQLRLVKSALENRDFVALLDALAYELADSSDRWRAAIRSIRSIIAG